MIASLRRRAAPLRPLMAGLPEPNTWRYVVRMGLQQPQPLHQSLMNFSTQHADDQRRSPMPRSFVRPAPTRTLYSQLPMVPLVMSKRNGLSSNSLSLVRCYSGGPRRDWVDMAKTGALVVLGTGALVATASGSTTPIALHAIDLGLNVLVTVVGFGFIITGAAAYGVYSLYQKFFGPYRSSPFGGSGSSGFDQMNSIFGDQRQPRSSSSRHADPNDLESLTQGMPFVVRGLVKTIFSFVGDAMQSSMARAGELRRMTSEYVESHPQVIAALGSSARISTPQQWMESSKLNLLCLACVNACLRMRCVEKLRTASDGSKLCSPLWMDLAVAHTSRSRPA